MAVRSDMQYIIDFVRLLINDPSGPTEQFSDQYIQDRLDMGRLDIYRECLRSADTLTTDGNIAWHDFFSRYAFWEEDYLIQEVGGTVRTPDSVELLVGKFHFNDSQAIPLLITGKVYNVYGVASGLLTTWVSTIRGKITSWTADGTTIQRIGEIRDMRNLASDYASKAWGWGNSTQVKLVRKDLKY